MRYKAYFSNISADLVTYVTSDVKPEDPGFDEQVVDAAYDENPGGICAHCSGYGSSRFSLEVQLSDGAEIEYIEDDAGNVVFGKRPY